MKYISVRFNFDSKVVVLCFASVHLRDLFIYFTLLGTDEDELCWCICNLNVTFPCFIHRDLQKLISQVSVKLRNEVYFIKTKIIFIFVIFVTNFTSCWWRMLKKGLECQTVCMVSWRNISSLLMSIGAKLNKDLVMRPTSQQL